MERKRKRPQTRKETQKKRLNNLQEIDIFNEVGSIGDVEGDQEHCGQEIRVKNVKEISHNCQISNVENLSSTIKIDLEPDHSKLLIPSSYANSLAGKDKQYVINISRIISVKGDGNCLYRTIALALFNNEEYYSQIRMHLTTYIKNSCHQLYRDFITDESEFNEILNCVQTDGEWGDARILKAIPGAYCIMHLFISDLYENILKYPEEPAVYHDCLILIHEDQHFNILQLQDWELEDNIKYSNKNDYSFLEEMFAKYVAPVPRPKKIYPYVKRNNALTARYEVILAYLEDSNSIPEFKIKDNEPQRLRAIRN